jgi:predicted nucleic acid-binding protein
LVKRHTGNAGLAKRAVTELSSLVHICDTAAEDIRTASFLAMPDFEDAVLSATAQREGAELIITRNTKDFDNSPVPAVLPKDFEEIMRNPGAVGIRAKGLG